MHRNRCLFFKAADIILIDLQDVASAGSHDPLVPIVCCGNQSLVDTRIVNGKVVVRRGQLLTQDTERFGKKPIKIKAPLSELSDDGLFALYVIKPFVFGKNFKYCW